MSEENEVFITTLQKVFITKKFQRTDEVMNPGQASVGYYPFLSLNLKVELFLEFKSIILITWLFHLY